MEAPVGNQQSKKTGKVKSTIDSSYVRAATASAVLVPLAAFLGGMNLGNHNETLVRN
jgi:hypothetical protein